MRPRPSTNDELLRDCLAAGAVFATVLLGAWLWVNGLQPLLH
jgi:hypothetical protein